MLADAAPESNVMALKKRIISSPSLPQAAWLGAIVLNALRLCSPLNVFFDGACVKIFHR
jgi:hypothetical protein